MLPRRKMYTEYESRLTASCITLFHVLVKIIPDFQFPIAQPQVEEITITPSPKYSRNSSKLMASCRPNRVALGLTFLITPRVFLNLASKEASDVYNGGGY